MISLPTVTLKSFGVSKKKIPDFTTHTPTGSVGSGG
jgi:hypothetical protein